MKRFVLAAGAAVGPSTAGALQSPPVARREPHSVKFGYVESENRGANPMRPCKTLVDNYFWLRDDKREAPEVLDLLKAENEFCESQTAHLGDLRKVLYNELLSHVRADDETVPYDYGPYCYSSKTVKGKAYREYWRNGEKYLDVNEVAKDMRKPSMCDVCSVSPSPRGSEIAYCVDDSGYETYDIKFLPPRTTKDDESRTHPAISGNVSGSVCWRDESRLLYATHDEAHRPYRVYQRDLRSGEDSLLFEDLDDLFNVNCWRDVDGTVFVESSSKETTEVYFMKEDDDKLELVKKREPGVEYVVASRGQKLYVVANGDGHDNRALYVASKDAPGDWRLLLPSSDERSLSEVHATKDFVVLTGREGGYTRVWVSVDGETAFDLVPSIFGGGSSADDEDDDDDDEGKNQAYEVVLSSSSGNVNYDVDSMRLVYSSMTTPRTTVDYFPKEGKFVTLKVQDVPNYDASKYATKRVLVESRDGVTNIPMTLLWRPDKVTQHVHLYGYGSYGICLEPSFSAIRLPLVDRGVVYALAHVRGGGEMGKLDWYERGGKYLTKQNTFFDFVDCATKLKEELYPNCDLSIEGRSAGGLLVGQSVNLEPSLFKAVIAGVPFVDLMVTMCDSSIPLSTEEWAEWGNPNSEAFFDYMLQYSPIDNVKEGVAYPAMLLVSGLWDPRVAYWEPAKWAQVLRHSIPNPRDVVLKMDLDAGHFSAADRYKFYSELAFDYAWLLDKIILDTKR